MKISIGDFKGLAPRISARALPDGMAQVADNARLLSSDLEPWQKLRIEEVLANRITPINTIYKLVDQWLSWAESDLGTGQVNVDVALGPIAGDTTHRFYFTGTDVPRVSNYALATDEANRGVKLIGQYPYKSYKLGVPGPTAAPVAASEFADYVSPSYLTINDGTNLTGWSVSDNIDSGSGDHRDVQYISAGASGGPLTGQYITMAGSSDTVIAAPDNFVSDPFFYTLAFDESLYQAFKFSFSAYSYGPTVQLFLASKFFCDALGNGPTIEIALNESGVDPTQPSASIGLSQVTASGSMLLGTASSASLCGVVEYVQNTGNPLPNTLRIEVVARFDGTNYVVDISLIDETTDAVICSLAGLSVQAVGGYLYFTPEGLSADPYSTHKIWQINQVQTFTAGASETITSTRYVYTFVNVLGEEGPPSPVSNIVQHTTDDEFETAVTGIADPSSGDQTDYGLETGGTPTTPGGKNLYRVVTGATDEVFQLVNTEGYIPYGQTAYVDVKDDTDLGEALSSSNYDLPPDNMAGILALPNGITIGFAGNQICPSVQNQPHAYPQAYRLATDNEIVGIAAIDANVVVITKAFPYIVTGDDPASLSMTKLELQQGGVSKRGIVYLRGYGVTYPTADGLWAIAGVGQVTPLTKKLFTRKEWQLLDPSSLIAEAHDDRYIGFFGTSGMVLDQETFGVTDLTFHAQATFVDQEADALYMILDGLNQVGDDGALQAQSVSGVTVLQMDDPDGETQLRYNWKSKLYQLPGSITFRMCKIRARDYADLELGLIADGVEFLTKAITSNREFVIPDRPCDTMEIRLSGTSAVSQFELAESVEELQ